MGCDIHAKLEIRENSSSNWRLAPIGVQTPSLPRDYSIFAALAGVRARIGETGLPSPKGFPSDASYPTIMDYYDIEVVDVPHSLCQPGQIPASEAKDFVNRYGCSVYHDRFEERICSPDWHNASWASDEELANALERAQNPSHEYYLLLMVMSYLKGCGYECRLVYWFDN